MEENSEKVEEVKLTKKQQKELERQKRKDERQKQRKLRELRRQGIEVDEDVVKQEDFDFSILENDRANIKDLIANNYMMLK